VFYQSSCKASLQNLLCSNIAIQLTLQLLCKSIPGFIQSTEHTVGYHPLFNCRRAGIQLKAEAQYVKSAYNTSTHFVRVHFGNRTDVLNLYLVRHDQFVHPGMPVSVNSRANVIGTSLVRTLLWPSQVPAIKPCQGTRLARECSFLCLMGRSEQSYRKQRNKWSIVTLTDLLSTP
jgi:hypothetical protein